MKDSFVFYRSFYEAIHKVKDKELKSDIFESICELALNENVIELNDSIGSIIMELIKPQIEANNKRYNDGKKGGRPKKTTGYEKIKTTGYENKKPNENENVNVNENDNENVNDNVITFYEANVGTLSPTIYEELIKLEKQYTGEIVIEAIRRAVLQNKRSMNYIKGILKNWGNRTLEEILEEDKNKNKSNVPSWFNEEIEKDEWEISDEDKKRFGIT